MIHRTISLKGLANYLGVQHGPTWGFFKGWGSGSLWQLRIHLAKTLLEFAERIFRHEIPSCHYRLPQPNVLRVEPRNSCSQEKQSCCSETCWPPAQCVQHVDACCSIGSSKNPWRIGTSTVWLPSRPKYDFDGITHCWSSGLVVVGTNLTGRHHQPKEFNSWMLAKSLTMKRLRNLATKNNHSCLIVTHFSFCK